MAPPQVRPALHLHSGVGGSDEGVSARCRYVSGLRFTAECLAASPVCCCLVP
jgi:hypothetical protein